MPKTKTKPPEHPADPKTMHMSLRLTVVAEVPFGKLIDSMHRIEEAIRATNGGVQVRLLKDRHAAVCTEAEARDPWCGCCPPDAHRESAHAKRTIDPDPVLKLDEVLAYLGTDQCGPLLGVEYPESGVHDIIRLLQEVRAWCLIAAHGARR